MSIKPKSIPTSSQTVGPYFRIGLEYLIDRAPAPPATAITIHGRVLDRDGAPVSDAMLEFWSGAREETSNPCAFPQGFRRVATDGDGAFSVALPKARPIKMENGSTQAPHLLVLVFARGLLRHLITCVYFDDEAENASDPVFLSVPAARRNSLIARMDRVNSFLWNVVLQGTDETVFFAW